MAYLFNSLSDDQDADPGKQNIFGGQQTDQGTTTGGQVDTVQKGNTNTSIQTGGGGSAPSQSSSQPAAKSQPGYNPQAQSSVFAAQAKTMALPTRALTEAEGNLNKGSQQLQEKANAYNAKAQETAKGFGLDESTLASAAGGNDEAYQKTAQRLQGGSPALFGGFEGLGAELPNIQNIKSTGDLYRAEAGPNYSAGQSRFDAALLRRNPAFVQQQQSLLGREKALRDQEAKSRDEETTKARDYLSNEYKTSTENIRNQLKGMGQGVVDAAKAKEYAEEQRRAALDPKTIALEQLKALKEQARKDYSAATPGTDQAKDAMYLDLLNDEELAGKLAGNVSINKDVDWQSLLTADDASKYNRLQGLLGSSENVTPGGALPGDFDFKTADAYQTLRDALGQRRAIAEAYAPPVTPIFSENLKIPDIDMSGIDIPFAGGKPYAPPKPMIKTSGSSQKPNKMKTKTNEAR